MATHSNILAWRIPWTKEPGGLQSTGWQRVRHNWNDLASRHCHSTYTVYFVFWFLPIRNSDGYWLETTSSFLLMSFMLSSISQSTVADSCLLLPLLLVSVSSHLPSPVYAPSFQPPFSARSPARIQNTCSRGILFSRCSQRYRCFSKLTHLLRPTFQNPVLMVSAFWEVIPGYFEPSIISGFSQIL